MTELEQLNRQCMEAFSSAFPEREAPMVFCDGGRSHIPMLLIGEAPGAQEIIEKKPFVGKAGKNLTEFLSAVGIDRSELAISNTVKIRPFRISEKGTVANRPPNRQELDFFIPWLRREILLLRPGLIVTLGNTPPQALMGSDTIIGQVHGIPQMVVVEGQLFRLFPLYHPAAVIYNRSLGETYRQDLRSLRIYLDS